MSESHPEQPYLELMRRIWSEGDERMDRTGVGTRSVFGAMLRFDLADGAMPLVTTKRVYWKTATRELLWFLTGNTNIRPLVLQGVKIWNEWPHARYVKETGEAIYEEEEMDLSPMPFIVVIVDEMADLMMVAGKEIEAAVQRLAQMARAAGIHIITATQRPSVDVITGTIKANFPTRISFQVTSKIDSRTILGEQGAEQLLGQGDMLYMAGGGRIRRVHGPFVSDEEVEKVVTFLKKQGVPEYLEAITAEEEQGDDPFAFDGGAGSGDDLYDKAVAIVARDKRASTSYIQRRLQIGYNRAARLIELMEEQGVVSPPNHQGKREVLVGDH